MERLVALGRWITLILSFTITDVKYGRFMDIILPSFTITDVKIWQIYGYNPCMWECIGTTKA